MISDSWLYLGEPFSQLCIQWIDITRVEYGCFAHLFNSRFYNLGVGVAKVQNGEL